MVDLQQTTSIIPTNPTQTSQIMVPQDNFAFLTGITINEIDYSLWSQHMEMNIGVYNKVGYLNGETKKLDLGDPNLNTRIIENHKIKSRLIDSVAP